MSIAHLLTHTCSIVQAATSSELGHTVTTWTTPAATTTGIACLIQPKVMREIATGAVIGTHMLYMDYDDAPASLLVHGAEKSHRVTTWVHNGLTDAGPFDVVEVKDPGGVAHHLELQLKRVG